jgi:hypothetical protein
VSGARLPAAVVGAGPSGLGCAVELAPHVPVVLIDRLPVFGGTAGWDRPEIRDQAATATALGAEPLLGQTAIRWIGQRLLVLGPGSCRWVTAQHLFMAGGLRPATVADLQITGDRPAGVVAATVAEHLLDTGVALWRTVVIIGEGPWAARVAGRARALGSRVVALGSAAGWADEHVGRPDRCSIVGRDRVRAVRLDYSGTGAASVDVACDAVVLAADPVPNRNVDGAVLAGSPGVTFVQPTSPYDAAGRFGAARRAAREWLCATGKVMEK